MSKSGIYRITNIINNKIYIGSSSNLKSRKYVHFNNLSKNKHPNNSLQSDYNKYGKDNFKWEIIEYVEKIEDKYLLRDILVNREQYWMDSYECYNKEKGYNLSPSANNNCGYKHSEKTKKLWSNIRSGRKLSEETKLKMSKAHMGKKHTNKSKIKMSKAHKGKKLSEKTIEKIKDKRKFQIITEEHKNKIGKAHKGMKHTGKSKIKMSNSCKDRYRFIDTSSGKLDTWDRKFWFDNYFYKYVNMEITIKNISDILNISSNTIHRIFKNLGFSDKYKDKLKLIKLSNLKH